MVMRWRQGVTFSGAIAVCGASCDSLSDIATASRSGVSAVLLGARPARQQGLDARQGGFHVGVDLNLLAVELPLFLQEPRDLLIEGPLLHEHRREAAQDVFMVLEALVMIIRHRPS